MATIIQFKNILARKQSKFLEVVKSPKLFKSLVKKERLYKLYLSLDHYILKAELASNSIRKRKEEKLLLWYYQIEFMALKEQAGAYLYALTGNRSYITTTVGEEIAKRVKQQASTSN